MTKPARKQVAKSVTPYGLLQTATCPKERIQAYLELARMEANEAKEQQTLLSFCQAVLQEAEDRSFGQTMSSHTHTPREQCRGLAEMFSNAWIH